MTGMTTAAMRAHEFYADELDIDDPLIDVAPYPPWSPPPPA